MSERGIFFSCCPNPCYRLPFLCGEVTGYDVRRALLRVFQYLHQHCQPYGSPETLFSKKNPKLSHTLDIIHCSAVLINIWVVLSRKEIYAHCQSYPDTISTNSCVTFQMCNRAPRCVTFPSGIAEALQNMKCQL